MKAAISGQSVDLWKTAEQRPSPDAVVDLLGSDERTERSALTVADCMTLCADAAFGPADQLSTAPSRMARSSRRHPCRAEVSKGGTSEP